MLDASNSSQDAKANSAATGSGEEIDLSLLEDSLRLTPWERLVENDRALALVRMLEQAGAAAYGTVEPNPGAA